MTPKELAIIAAKALDEKKGKEISAIQVTEQTTLADYFVFATGSSNTQINALCGAVEKAMDEQGVPVLRLRLGDPLVAPGEKLRNAAVIEHMGGLAQLPQTQTQRGGGADGVPVGADVGEDAEMIPLPQPLCRLRSRHRHGRPPEN